MTANTSSRVAALSLMLALVSQTSAFLPHAKTSLLQNQNVLSTAKPAAALNMFMDPATMVESANTFMDSASTNLLSFTDQGQNLAGVFFQASLLPYLLFLYFLSFRANRISDLGNFGFQFILLFVLSTIPAGIISKVVYGTSLANVDFLHGGAETLLTVANVLIVLGFKDAMTNPEGPKPMAEAAKSRNVALGIFAAVAAVCGLATQGPAVGIGAHTPFLFGLGDLPASVTASLPWVTHTEPANALTIPTWMIHFSSVFEYLFAMNLVWQYSQTTGNEKWKGLTWGMLPLHASGICACTYHFFYNDPSLQFLVSSQAGLTLLGNITCMIAAFRIAKSNGWTLAEANPFPKSSTSPTGLVADDIAAMPLETIEPAESNAVLAAKLVGITVLASYAVKYGELGLDVPFSPNAPLAIAMIVGIPAITAYQYAAQSKNSEDDSIFDFLPSLGGDEGKPSLSMNDVKKYGVAGTVAYVLTELAFWAVAFPVASTTLYQSTGHWPDVINDASDRAAVIAFIFAGANIARAAVPFRFGAALALAPWVDENLIQRFGGETSTSKPSEEKPSA